MLDTLNAFCKQMVTPACSPPRCPQCLSTIVHTSTQPDCDDPRLLDLGEEGGIDPNILDCTGRRSNAEVVPLE